MIHFVQPGYQGGQALCGASAENLSVTSTATEVRCESCKKALRAQRVTAKAEKAAEAPVAEPKGSVVSILDAEAAPEPSVPATPPKGKVKHKPAPPPRHTRRRK